MRSSSSEDFSLFAMDYKRNIKYLQLQRYFCCTCKKRLMNQVREYWYIGSILAKSDIQKNRIAEWMATGL